MINLFGKDVPTELGEIVQPKTTAFIIIDMQNDACSKGGSSDAAGADLTMYPTIIPRIASFREICKSVSVPIIHVGMVSLPDGRSDSPAWLRMRLRVKRNYDAANDGALDLMVEGGWGADFIPELTPEEGDLIVKKYRSSAFYNTELDLLLKANGIKTAIVAGCTTEGCVESTVRDLCFYDYFPVVLTDCVGSDSQELHDASLLVMSAYRADVTTSTTVSGLWKSQTLLATAVTTEA